METKLILRRKSEVENSTFVGYNSEVIAVSGKGIALHDGGTPGGMLLEPRIQNSLGTNFIRNGNFIVSQNGVMWLGVGGSGYAYIADGWYFVAGGESTANCAVSRTYTDGEDDAYSALRITNFSGGLNNSFSVLSQQIDDVRLLAGRKVTVSFKAKASTPRRVAIVIRQDFKGEVGVEETFAGNAEITTSWQYYTFTVTIPPILSTTVISSGNFTGLWIWLEAGSNYDPRTGGIGITSGSFDITNIKIEIGNAATSFGATQLATELRKVQEYYEKHITTQYMSMWAVNDAASVAATTFMNFLVPKIKPPTISGLTTNFLSNAASSVINEGGFNVIGTPNSAVSVARVLGYTANAEIPPY